MNDVLDAILDLLRAAMSSRITTFYQGEVVVPPKSYLPALMVFGNSTSIEALSTAKDRYVHGITIKIVADIMTYVADAGTGEVIKSDFDLIDLVEGRNTGLTTLKADSVLGVLRNSVNLKTQRWHHNNEFQVNYQTIQTGQFPYSQASVTFSVVTDLIARS